MGNLSESLDVMSRWASAELARAQGKFEATMAEVAQLRKLSERFPDLTIESGVACSALANPLMESFTTTVGCGCHPEPGDDVVLTPSVQIDGVRVGSQPMRFVLGTERERGMTPIECWREQFTQAGFSTQFIDKVQLFIDENTAPSQED